MDQFVEGVPHCLAVGLALQLMYLCSASTFDAPYVNISSSKMYMK